MYPFKTFHIGFWLCDTYNYLWTAACNFDHFEPLVDRLRIKKRDEYFLRIITVRNLWLNENPAENINNNYNGNYIWTNNKNHNGIFY